MRGTSGKTRDPLEKTKNIMASIQLKNLTKRYSDGRTPVNNINLTIEDGEFIVLVGPSGCGKSTTLNMIAGLEDITDGEIIIDGTVVNHIPASHRDIAMVFQSYALYPHMTVRQNLSFPLRMAKKSPVEISQAVDTTAELLNLTELLDKKPSQLSGGQRQRVAMGRALVRKPKAFLMDEPLSNLDAQLRNQMRLELSKLHDQFKTTTIYVTHDQTEALTLGQRIVILAHGTCQQIGTPQEVYHHPANAFVANFIGSPSINFVPVEQITDHMWHTPLGNIPIPAHLQGYQGSIVLGIRPQSLHLTGLMGHKRSDLITITGIIRDVEFLGTEQNIHLSLEYKNLNVSHTQWQEYCRNMTPHITDRVTLDFVARLPPLPAQQRLDTVELLCPPEEILVFDYVTGENITHPDSLQR